MGYGLILLLITAAVAQAEDCSPDPQHIQSATGTITIDKSKNCGFIAADNSKYFAIETSDLDLSAGDSLTITSDKHKDYTTVLTPPLSPGYLMTGPGLEEPTFQFTFGPNRTGTINAKFLQDVAGDAKLPVNGDINNNIHIKALHLKNLKIIVKKTIAQPIHVEVSGAIFDETKLGHTLVKSNDKTLSITLIESEDLIIKTHIVNANCSSIFPPDTTDIVHDIVGPIVNNATGNYRCVSIFSTEPKSHYEVDFKDFIELVDPSDTLTIDDGEPKSRLVITDPVATLYSGQKKVLKSNFIAIIYDSPSPKASQVQYKLSVISRRNGGVVQDQGPLKFSAGTEARFVLQPQDKQYAAIELLKDEYKMGSNDVVRVFQGSRLLAEFAGGMLPPIIAMNDASTDMIFELKASDLIGYNNVFTFKSLPMSCHRLSSETPDVYSLTGALSQGYCCWTVAAKQYSDMTFIRSNSTTKGCMTIQPMDTNVPLYKECNISSRLNMSLLIEVPTYVLFKGLDNTTSLAASLTASVFSSNSTLKPLDKVYINSDQYPLSYQYSAKSQVYELNAKDKSYVITVKDLDVRENEIVSIDGKNQAKTKDVQPYDIVVANKTILINIDRSRQNKADFSDHRGFSIEATKFGNIISANAQSKLAPVPVPSNLPTYITISGKSDSPTKFGSRIAYNIIASDNTVVKVHDGRSFLSKPVDGLKGETISDTLIIEYSKKPSKLSNFDNDKIPTISVETKKIPCNTTQQDHICDSYTKCVVRSKLCKGVQYCNDASDLKVTCNSDGPVPPKIINSGLSSISVFVLCVFMLTLGVFSALYGPDIFKTIEARFRSAQYTTFTSTE